MLCTTPFISTCTDELPFSVRVLLESAVRNCDNFQVKTEDVERILDWKVNRGNNVEVAFKPARVLLQDFTGVPAVVDFAAIRDTVKRLGGDPLDVNPLCPADLVIDHSVQVDYFKRFVVSSRLLVADTRLYNLLCQYIPLVTFLVADTQLSKRLYPSVGHARVVLLELKTAKNAYKGCSSWYGMCVCVGGGLGVWLD